MKLINHGSSRVSYGGSLAGGSTGQGVGQGRGGRRGGLPRMWNVLVTMALESRVGRKAPGRPHPSDTTVRFMAVYDLILFGKEKGEHEYLSTR